MDLILFQFGDDSFLKPEKIDPDETGSGTGGSNIDGDEGPDWSGLVSNPHANKFNPDLCVELVSVNQGLKQQVTTDVSNSARTSGRPMITDFTCVKYVDSASPKMYDYCLRAKTLNGTDNNKCYIYVLRNSGDQMNMMMCFELKDVLISEIQFQSHPNDMATEQFKLNFTEIVWVHQVQGLRMTNSGQIAAGWSVAKNRPIAI